MHLELCGTLLALASLAFPTLVVALGKRGGPSRPGARELAWLCAWFSQAAVVMAFAMGMCVLLVCMSGSWPPVVALSVGVGLTGVSAVVGWAAVRALPLARLLLRARWAELQTQTRPALKLALAAAALAGLAIPVVAWLPFPGRWDSTPIWFLVTIPSAAFGALAPLIVAPVWWRARTADGASPFR